MARLTSVHVVKDALRVFVCAGMHVKLYAYMPQIDMRMGTTVEVRVEVGARARPRVRARVGVRVRVRYGN